MQFWSGEATTCTIPGCIEGTVPIPVGAVETNVTIDCTYDPPCRPTCLSDILTFFQTKV